jgi:hypothetical protein
MWLDGAAPTISWIRVPKVTVDVEAPVLSQRMLTWPTVVRPLQSLPPPAMMGYVGRGPVAGEGPDSLLDQPQLLLPQSGRLVLKQVALLRVDPSTWPMA